MKVRTGPIAAIALAGRQPELELGRHDGVRVGANLTPDRDPRIELSQLGIERSITTLGSVADITL